MRKIKIAQFGDEVVADFEFIQVIDANSYTAIHLCGRGKTKQDALRVLKTRISELDKTIDKELKGAVIATEV